MFHPGYWAAAYLNSLEKEGAGFEDSFAMLGILSSWAKSLPGEVFGCSAAQKIETLIRRGVAEKKLSGGEEIAVRFLILMIKKNRFRYIDTVIDEIKRSLDNKNRVLSVSAEYALPPGGDFEFRIKEAVKKQTGAHEVKYSGKTRPELIGGYRLRIGDTVIDASILSRLSKLEDQLITGADWAGPAADGGN